MNRSATRWPAVLDETTSLGGVKGTLRRLCRPGHRLRSVRWMCPYRRPSYTPWCFIWCRTVWLVCCTFARGDPATELIKAATDQHADLIAMSTHRHFISDVLLGATANRVRHLVKIPVLLLRAQ